MKPAKPSRFFRRLFARSVGGRLLMAGTLVAMLAGPAAAITVDNVVQMHKSGLPAPVIIQTIQSTGSTFSLSDADRKTLADAGVPAAVIEVMKSAGGGAAPAPEPAPEPEPAPVDALEQLRNSEESERAKIEENARVQEAVRRAAEAERNKMRAEEASRITAALKTAREALDAERYHEAAVKFDEFIRATDANKPAVISAKLGLADALANLKLYGNAAGLYHEVVDAGAEHEAFQKGFEGLRNTSRLIAYNPVTLESLGNHFVGNFSPAFQSNYNYFVGRFFFDYNRNEEARRYLALVPDGAAEYGEAQYLLGLIVVQEAGEDAESSEFIQSLIKASEHFQTAVLAAERTEEQRITHLAYLALARIAYTLRQYDAAIFYYRKVPADSTNYVNALHESAWSYFLKGDTKRGMGIFHTLDGPDWVDYFLPDTYLLEATVFTNACRYDYAREALARIEGRYLALRKPLQAYLAEYSTPDALYRAFVLKQTRRGIELPRLVRMAIVAHPEFNELYGSVTLFRREVARIKADAALFGPQLTQSLLETIESRQQERTLALGIKLNQLMQALDDELGNLEVQVTEVRIEIDEAALDDLSGQIQDANAGETKALTQDAQSQATATTLVGDKYVTWPFEGEYWSDEINNYRSDLTEVCKR